MVQGLERTTASNYTIEELLVLVDRKNVQIPYFQRGQRWEKGDIAKLFDSIYKGYPIGTLLFWKRPGTREVLWVVDGQQRITALARVLLREAEGPPTARELYFSLATEQFVWHRQGGPHDTHLPLSEAYKLPNVMAWLRERDLDSTLQARSFKLADRLRNYLIPAYSVETKDDRDIEPLREVFDRINTFGKRMTRAEVFHALTSLNTPGKRDLSQLAHEIGALGFGSLPCNTLMLCVLSVRGPDVLRDFRTEFPSGSPHLARTIDRAETAIKRAIVFLREDAGVLHFDLVPYQYLLVTLVRFFSLHANCSEWERVLLRRWYWRAAVHGPLPKLGSTGTLRLALNAISTDRSAIETVMALLREFPNKSRPVEVGAMHWNRADAKTTLCAMAALRPLNPSISNGAGPQEIDITEALTIDRQAALPRVFDYSAARGAPRSLANRVFWPPSANDDPTLVLASAERAVLESHAISQTAAAALQCDDSESFVRTRERDIRARVADFVDARAEWERPTRPPLASL